jgi:hypothetical protein
MPFVTMRPKTPAQTTENLNGIRRQAPRKRSPFRARDDA